MLPAGPPQWCNMHRRRLFLLVLAPLLLAGISRAADKTSHAGSSPAPYRMMSFNVRTARAQDGVNAWPHRLEFLFETIRRFGPDLIGFQEVVEAQHDEIVKRMPEYVFSGVARDDGKRKGEWSLVGYRRDRFERVDHGDFWLSENPKEVGSKSWDAALTRICTWTRLRDKVNRCELVYANTHFDHKGVVARQEASRVLSIELSKIANGVPALLTGDLNINEDNPAYAVLVRPDRTGAIRWIDSYREVHPRRMPDEASFNGFKGTQIGSRIDFVFHTDDFVATSSEIDRSAMPDGRFPSDHYPVTAVLKLK